MTRAWRALAVAVLVLGGAATQISSQTPRLARVMREKLSHSQVILAALVTSNWTELERHSLALQEATADPAWAVLTEPEYARQTVGFTRALDQLVDAAKRRDLEASPEAYVAMTMSCVQCHRYVAGRRLAGAEKGPVQ